MLLNCPSVFLGMATFQICINVDPAVVKFLSWHLKNENEVLILTTKNYFGSIILSKLSRATFDDIKDNMTGNLQVQIPMIHIPELGIDLRTGGAVGIKMEQQREINNFFKSFMSHVIGLEIDALTGKIKDRIAIIREKYQITDEEISFSAFEKGYYRYKAQYNKKLSDKYNNRG